MDGLNNAVSLTYRAAEQGDIGFILNSWMKSHRTWVGRMNNEAYFSGQQALIAALSEISQIVICCDATPKMRTFVLGYVCGEMDVATDTLILHYIYVKKGYRRAGIARDLLTAIGRGPRTKIIATHWTCLVRDKGTAYNMEYSDYPLKMGYQRAQH